MHITRPVKSYNACHFDSIHARRIAIQSLPPRYPARRCIRECDQALKNLAGAILYNVRVAGQLEELFAVWTALIHKLRMGLDDAADHAGAK